MSSTVRRLSIVLAFSVAAATAVGCDGDVAGVPAESTATACQDGEDNDADGHVDCADQDCELFVFCVGSGLDARVPPADAGGGPDAGDSDGGGADVCRPFCPVPDGSPDGCGGCCGECPIPAIAATPEVLAFGPRLLGRTATLRLQITSVGRERLWIGGVELLPGASPSFTLEPTGEVAGGTIPVTSPFVLGPGRSVTLTVFFAPEAIGEVDSETGEPLLETATLRVHNGSERNPLDVPISGYGVVSDCPVFAVLYVEEGAELIRPTNLHLYGDQSIAQGGQIVRWEWRVEQPSESRSVFVPAPGASNPTFKANVVGSYAFSLDVWDEEGRKSCEPATYEVVVAPSAAIYIEVLWTTPGDPDETDRGPFAGSDVDLHFLHPDAPSDADAPDLDRDQLPDPYFDQTYDCHWSNPLPDWGVEGAAEDDPSLDRNDFDGAGPESVRLDAPETGRIYEVAVHYGSDYGYGASFVTVRVYVRQVLKIEIANVRLINFDLWSVAWIEWPSGEVTLREAPGGEYWIIPNYQHPSFFNK